MKTALCKSAVVVSFLFVSQASFAQSGGSSSSYWVYSLIGVGVFLLLFAVLTLADNLIQIEAKKKGVNTKKTNMGIVPTLGDIFGKRAPSFVEGDFYNLTKGYDLKLAGEADGDKIESFHGTRYAIQPTDFIGISPIPKVTVEVGDNVKAGDQIFFDKKRPEIAYAAPVSGEVIEVIRGAKRSIAKVVILADKEISSRTYDVPNIETANREDLVKFLSGSGVWPLINQRPFDIVAETEVTPRDIFISTFDTAPLAVDQNVVVAGKENAFQQGLDVLGKLTDGAVYLGLDGKNKPHDAFANAKGVEKNYFSGAHPAGNVGIQMHHVKPIRGNDKVWTLTVQSVIAIGELFLNGNFDASRVVGVVGSQVKEPKLYRTYQGVNIGEITANQLSDEKLRIVSGDVFTGRTVGTDDFVSYQDDQVTVIRENDEYELFGWLLPIKPRPSTSNTFPNFLYPNFKFEGETNTHGERRAFVVTGQYEQVLPMNVYPQQLMKAILTGDIEKMEGLGINELSEEDVALCEFVCTSKMPLQSILRDGLEMIREQS